MFSFQDLGFFPITITLMQKSKKITPILFLCLEIQRGMRATPLGFCRMVIVTENP